MSPPSLEHLKAYHAKLWGLIHDMQVADLDRIAAALERGEPLAAPNKAFSQLRQRLYWVQFPVTYNETKLVTDEDRREIAATLTQIAIDADLGADMAMFVLETV